MKHYIIEAQEGTEGKKQPVTAGGKIRQFFSPQIAVKLARLVKTELGDNHHVRVISKGHDGPQEIIEV